MADEKATFIEVRLSDGTILRAEGDHAAEVWSWLNSCEVMAHIHGGRYSLLGDAAQLTEKQCQMILERERTKVAEAYTAIKHIIDQRDWLTEGRGPYEWDDDKWHKEFAYAADEIKKALEPLQKIASDLSNCPQKWEEVVEARRTLSSSPQPQSANFIAEVRPQPPYPSCHVCGAEMVPDGYKCLSCGANTKPSSPQPGSEPQVIGLHLCSAHQRWHKHRPILPHSNCVICEFLAYQNPEQPKTVDSADVNSLALRGSSIGVPPVDSNSANYFLESVWRFLDRAKIRYSRDHGMPNPSPPFRTHVEIDLETWDELQKLKSTLPPKEKI